jgi:hypothetical protein
MIFYVPKDYFLGTKEGDRPVLGKNIFCEHFLMGIGRTNQENFNGSGDSSHYHPKLTRKGP